MDLIPSDDIQIYQCGECYNCDTLTAMACAWGSFHGGSFYIEMQGEKAYFAVWNDDGDMEEPNVVQLWYPYPPDYNDKSRRSSAILLIILGRIIVEFDAFMAVKIPRDAARN